MHGIESLISDPHLMCANEDYVLYYRRHKIKGSATHSVKQLHNSCNGVAVLSLVPQAVFSNY